MSVEFIFFDVLGVLLTQDKDPLAEFERTHGFQAGEAWQVWRKYAKRVQTGQITLAQYPDYPHLAALIDALNANSRPAPGLEDLIKLLTGYRLGVISNFTPELDEVLEGAGLRRYFETVVNSALVGVRKPDPEIYRIACSSVGVEPDLALLIDDKEENVQAAIAFGMKAIQFTDVEALREQLIQQRIVFS